MITLDQVKIIREKKKDNPDQINLFGNNGGKKKKYNQPSKEQSDAIQSRSANRDAKKYASGEYPKIGGGERMSPKSKGPGASTGGTKIPPATVGGKSKGTTPAKVNITKPVKQSEVSKKAKEFTTKINKANVNRKEFPGDKSGAYKRVKADIETKNLIKKAGGTGDIGFTAPDRKTKVAKRTTRAIKQGTPDPHFSKTKFSQKDFEKSLVSKKAPKTPSQPIVGYGGKKVPSDSDKFKSFTSSVAKKGVKGAGQGDIPPAPPGLFGKGDTPAQIKIKAMDKKAFKVTQPKDVPLPKSFTDFSKKLKAYRVDRDIERKIKNPKLDISKVIKKRKSETPVQQTIPGTGGNRNIKKTYNKRKPRQKPPSGGGSSKYTQGSLFDPPSGGGKPSGSGSSGGGGGKPPGGSIVTTGGGGGNPPNDPIDPEVVQGRFKEKGKGKSGGSGNMSNKQFKQFRKDYKKSYKDFKKSMENTVKGQQKVTTSANLGSLRDTAKFQRRAANISRGLGGNKGKRAALGKIGKFIKNKPGKAGLIALGAYGAYQAGKYYLNRKDDLNINKDFAKTTTIKNPSGQNVRFRYSNRKDKDGNPIYKDQASSFLTKDKKNKIGGTIPGGLTKFRTGQYTANYKSGGKVGGRIDIDKNMRNSAFEKQLQRAEKGTGLFGRQRQQDKDFLRKYKNATRPTAVK